MHFCGNPFHDIPFYLALALPWLAPFFLWLKHSVKRPKAGDPKCDCPACDSPVSTPYKLPGQPVRIIKEKT